MTHLSDVLTYLEEFAPLQLAEDWDNVGLLIGDRNGSIERVMTCLTVTPDSVDEAVTREADLVVSHHPFPFRAVKTVTADDTVGKMMLQLIRHDIRVYSPHTAFDSAQEGINQQLATALGIPSTQPIIPEENGALGAGRCGALDPPAALNDVMERLKTFLGIRHCRFVGALDRTITHAAVACGSAGQFLGDAARHGCELLVTGETSFHTCLEAEARGVALVLLGHFASERFAVEALAGRLDEHFPQLEVWASQQEVDPLQLA